MLVTTSLDPSQAAVARGREAALRTGGRYVPRKGLSLQKLRQAYGDPILLLVKEQGMELHREDGREPLFFHPSTALLRIKRLLRGEADTLIDASGTAAGDRILDCTAGLASDAIVFAYAAGEQGRVLAVESEALLHFIVQTGLQQYQSDVPEVNEAMRRVELVQADHLELLASLPDRSVEVVYFDPMFRIPIYDSNALSPIRGLANAEALRDESIEHAKRVATKTIVLKEHKDSGEFERLGFRPILRNPSKFNYGVIQV
ncbi:class I SAM-dependent methyltransferase [Paenibacillus turpanensis]|uniref:class I SAM-dependent methyltransferase n=1 Tax=Paenibacillus turpanensis TaxID=2689078 RepID=UPI001407879A|nr:class I SAM-dependent methyltransferase [Paenibacillus turpanensis]